MNTIFNKIFFIIKEMECRRAFREEHKKCPWKISRVLRDYIEKRIDPVLPILDWSIARRDFLFDAVLNKLCDDDTMARLVTYALYYGAPCIYNALLNACFSGRTNAVSILIKHMKKEDFLDYQCMCIACDWGHCDILRMLLRLDAYSNTSGEFIGIMLGDSAYGGRYDVCKVILEEQSHKISQEQLHIAHHFAKGKGHREICALIEKYIRK